MLVAIVPGASALLYLYRAIPPNAWDHVPQGEKIACGESSQWGDYHAREAALYVQRMIDDASYYSFFGCLGGKSAT